MILQPFATVVLRKLGPRVFLPSITILWGLTAMCFGFVLTWKQMIALRLVLGIFEAGFFPGKLDASAHLTRDHKVLNLVLQVVRIFCPAGIRDTIYKRGTQSFI